MKRYRQRKAITGVTEGVTRIQGVTEGGRQDQAVARVEGVTEKQGITDDMMDKLTSDFWRGRLTKICNAFHESSHPDYMLDVWLGDYNMAQVCELLEVTNGKV